ncbi:MAG TPA: hypothetical protein VK327_12380, partial [Candidatus Paceibacterota bacterium]|nr:hypothetical protein [Candidatus Paceibacterota bacterium]
MSGVLLLTTSINAVVNYFTARKSTSEYAFSPTVERVVMAFDENPAQACLDFKSGEFRSPPTDITESIRHIATNDFGAPFEEIKASGDGLSDWLNSSGVDLIGSQGSDGGLQVKYIGQPPHFKNGWTSFASVSPGDVIQALRTSPFFAGDKPNLPDVYINVLNPKLDSVRKANFIIFRTHDGDVGVMQIPGLSQPPRGVKLRYKLVQNRVTTVTPVSLPVADKPNVFSPVIERTISGKGDAEKRFIDFDSGKLFAAAEFFGPKDEPSPEETLRWRQSTGIDAVGDTSKEVRGLVGFEMAAVPAPSTVWDETNPQALDFYLEMAKPGTPVVMSGRGELPVTFVIRTHEGSRGVVQITGFAENPPGVKIRYKLMQSAGSLKRLGDLGEADRTRAVALFNDIEDFGHEFSAAFTARNLAAAQTSTRRLQGLLTSFNAVVRGTDCEFPAELFDRVAALKRALDGGNWGEIAQAAAHNEEFAREFRRIGEQVAGLARQIGFLNPPSF